MLSRTNSKISIQTRKCAANASVPPRCASPSSTCRVPYSDSSAHHGARQTCQAQAMQPLRPARISQGCQQQHRLSSQIYADHTSHVPAVQARPMTYCEQTLRTAASVGHSDLASHGVQMSKTAHRHVTKCSCSTAEARCTDCAAI